MFAGLKDGAASGESSDTTSARVIRAWQKHRESIPGFQGTLVALPLDVTREDLLHEAVDIIRAHLPAGEDGMSNKMFDGILFIINNCFVTSLSVWVQLVCRHSAGEGIQKRLAF